MNKIKEYTRILIEEVIEKYVKEKGMIDFCCSFVNKNGQFVVIEDSSDGTSIDYSIKNTMLYTENTNKSDIDGGQIIFKFDNDMADIDEDEITMYQEDYFNYSADKERYIKEKVNYIMQLTWE